MKNHVNCHLSGHNFNIFCQHEHGSVSASCFFFSDRRRGRYLLTTTQVSSKIEKVLQLFGNMDWEN